MKRRLVPIVVVMVMLFTFSACGTDSVKNSGGSNELLIVCAGFAEYDFTMNILGDLAAKHNVIYLGENGADMHSFQPSTGDIALINTCNLIIYAGGTSQDWIDETIGASGKSSEIDMMRVLSEDVLTEELKEGMEEDEDEDVAEGPEYDEHLWLSVRKAVEECHEITKALSKLDSANALYYKENETAYTNELLSLDEEYAAALEDAPLDTVVFADRFPFRYLVEDYGIDYYAAFPGCSAESEASFETVVFLAGKCDELGLPAVLQIEGSQGNITTAVANASKVKPQILTMNSMQSISREDIENGASYINIMKDNLQVLKTALGR